MKHKVEPSGIAFVEVSSSQKAMEEWLGKSASPQMLQAIRYSGGELGIKAVGINTPSGIAVLKSP